MESEFSCGLYGTALTAGLPRVERFIIALNMESVLVRVFGLFRLWRCLVSIVDIFYNVALVAVWQITSI